MNAFHVIILAVIQAITEFVPVSSSGHLLAASELFGLDSSLGLDVMLHVGTLFALVVYFWNDLVSMVKEQASNRRLIQNVIISTIPAAAAGFFLRDFFEGDARQLGWVILMLVVVGIFMIAADYLLGKGNASPKRMSNNKALIVGLGQALALIPGTSRSGITMLSSRAVGMGNKQAARYSFLIGIPIIAGAGLKVLLEPETSDYIASFPLNTLIGVSLSALLGLFVLRFLIDFVARRGLAVFGWYRLALAAVLFIIWIN